MKIIEVPENPFKKIGTIIAYRERMFYPGNAYNIMGKPGIINDIIEQSTAGTIMYPSSVNSDLSEFSLYNFNFDLLNDKKYIPEFIPGMLDDYSLEILGEDLDTLSSLIVPQISTSTAHEGAKFFGGFQDSQGNQIRLIDLPVEYTEEDTLGIWKVEIYNEKIEGNMLVDGKPEILDHDSYLYLTKAKVFENLTEENSIPKYVEKYKPCVQIYFGPQYKTKLKDKTLTQIRQEIQEDQGNKIYPSRYISLEEDYVSSGEYDSFTEELTESEYIKQYKNEVMSRKILYLAYNGEGKIEALNLIGTSFENSKNPARNQHLKSSRMDDYLSHDQNILKGKGNLVFDKTSGVLLGNISSRVFPILESRKTRAPKSLRTYSRKIELDGNTFIKSNSTRLWEDPIISPDWSLERKIKSNYSKCYISSTEGGNISPSGICYVKDSLTVIQGSPKLGYEIDKIIKTYEVNGSYKEEEEEEKYEKEYTYTSIIPTSLKFIYKETSYVFDIKFEYKESEESNESSIMYLWDFPVKFLNSNGEWINRDWEEEGRISIDNSTKLTFKINWEDEDCGYSPIDDFITNSSGEVLAQNSDGSYTVTLSDIGIKKIKSGLEEYWALISVPVKKRLFTITTSTDSENIQIKDSSLIFEYGEDEAFVEFYSKLTDFLFEIEKDGEKIDNIGDYITILNPSSNIWKIKFYNEIKNNYNIKIYENKQ